MSTRLLPPSKVETAPACEPSYKMLLEPPAGVAEYVIIDISLPGVVRIMPLFALLNKNLPRASNVLPN